MQITGLFWAHDTDALAEPPLIVPPVGGNRRPAVALVTRTISGV